MKNMKKLLFLLCTMLLGVNAAWATTYTITYGTSTGTFYNGGGSAVTSGWIAKWVSNETGKPKVTLTASANNINAENGRMAPGSAGSSTYTLTVESGYTVTGFSMNCPTFGAAVTVTPSGESATAVSTGGTLILNSSASSFVYSGNNSGRIQASASDGGSFTITVEDDAEAQSWIPSFGTGSTIVVTGDKTESVTAATNGADNDHWYIITQVRNGESALYDNGTQLMRGSTDKTAVSFNGAIVESNSAYLVRFISAGSEDLYHIQLGNGRYIVNLDSNPGNGTAVNTTSDYRNKGTHAFYNSNGGSGSYFGWNLNTKSAKKVDNNGAGNTLSYWGEGTASGTSGNSIWYVYPVTINTPASTVDVTYNLVIGGNIVNTVEATVAANSDINIPSELTAGYALSYYNLNTSGTIGDVDCTITVTAALKDNTVVYPYTGISNNKSYYIYTNNQARGGLSTYTDSETTYLAASVKSALSVSPKKFAILSYEGNYYLYSVDDAKFVTYDGVENTKAALAATVTGTSDRITFTQTNAPLYEVKFDGSSSKIFNSSNSSSYPYGMVLNTWGSSSSQWDDGCQYTINEAEDFDPTDALAALEAYFHPSYSITYIVKDVNDNTIFTSDPVATELGAHITTLPAKYQRDFCSYNTVDVTISALQTNIEFTATYDMPFTISSDFASATWYYVNAHASFNNRYISTNEDALVWGVGNGHTDAYKWAFIGNPYGGFKVVNKAAGDTKFLQETNPLTMATTNKAWTIKQQTNTSYESGSNGFGIWSEVNDQYVNAQASTLKYWGSFDQGSTFWVTEAPAYEVDVTYDLYVGGEKVNTEVVEYVAGGSAVNVPASLIANYSSLGYDFETSGTIGNTDCTITVTATLKTGVIENLSGLTNNKSYTLTAERGALYIKSDHLASNYNDNAGADAGKFALIKFGDNYYLYSVDASKYVLNDGSLSTTVTSDVVALNMTAQSAKPLFLFVLGTNGLNVTDSGDDYELVINSWVTADEGNRYIIKEADAFDPAGVVSALDEFFNGPTAFANAIAELKAINWSTAGKAGELNHYNFTGIYAIYAGNEASIITSLESAGYSSENLAIAQDMLANYALNMPATGKFYRIKGYSNNYITSNAAGSNASMNATASANNIVYYNGSNNLIFFGSGLGLYNTSIVAPVGSTLNAYTFSAGAQKSHYYIRSNAAGVGTYCYDNTAHASVRLDRNTNPVTSGSYQTDWTLEEVTALPVTISTAKYATLYTPVALTVPAGVTAYWGQLEADTYIRLTAIEAGETIPQNAGVILYADVDVATTFNFNIVADVTALDGNQIKGTITTKARSGEYTLQNGTHGIAFYSDGPTNLTGFKAYLDADSSPVKMFLFDDETAIRAIEAAQNPGKVVYDLNGRRVMNPAKGLYIVNGKKVVIK